MNAATNNQLETKKPNSALLSRQSQPVSMGKITTITNLPSYLEQLHTPLPSRHAPLSKHNSQSSNSHSHHKPHPASHLEQEQSKVSREMTITPQVSTTGKDGKGRVPKSRQCYFMREAEENPNSVSEERGGKNQQIRLKNQAPSIVQPLETQEVQPFSTQTLPRGETELGPMNYIVTKNALPSGGNHNIASQSQKTLPIIVPTFVEVQVPYLVPAQESSPPSQKSRVSIRSDHSSIDQIITDFSRKIDSIRQSQQDSNCFHQYRPVTELPLPKASKQQPSSQSQGLPLDSFEERPNIRLKSEISQSMSSPPRERNQIWDCPQMQLKQEFLQQLQEGQKFQLRSEGRHLSTYNSPQAGRRSAQLQQVSHQNKQLYQTVSFLQQKLLSAQQMIQQMENRQKRYIDQHQQTDNRYIEVIEQNRQLNALLIQEKEQVFKHQTNLHKQSKELTQVHEQLEKALSQLQYKENCLDQLVRVYQEKDDENRELLQTISQIQTDSRTVIGQYEAKLQEAYKQIDRLEEKIQFYHKRFQEQGLNLNITEAQEIRQIIEDKEAHTSNRITSIQQKYQKEINQLKLAQERLQKDKEYLQKQIQVQASQEDVDKLLASYDAELKQRDEEILKLKGTLKEQKMLKQNQINPQVGTLIEQSKIHYDLSKAQKALAKAQQQIAYERREKEKVIKKMMELSQGYEKYMQDYTSFLDMKTNQPTKKPSVKRKPTSSSRKTKTVHNQGESSSFSSAPSSLPVLEVKQSKKAESELCSEESCFNITPATLDIVFENSFGWSYQQKCELGAALSEYGLEMIEKFKKLPALNPCELLVTQRQGKFEIVYQSSGESPSVLTDRYLLYRSPEVLLGFSETESSYVWTIGLVIDAFLNGAFFYRKLSDITNIKNNYYCRDQKLSLGGVLKQAMVKNQKLRPSLKWLLKEFTKQQS